jgi:putative membrane protein
MLAAVRPREEENAMRKSLVFIITAAIVAVVAVMLVRAARDDSNRFGPISATPLSTADLQFVATAAESNDAEMDIAELARSTTKNSELKTLAERIEADHKQSNRELMEIADKKDADFPGAIGLPGMTEAQKVDRDRLDQLAGAEFDRAWIDHMVTEHQKAIDLYTGTGTRAADTDVKAYADRTLPVLRAHLEEAKRLQGGIR